MSERTAWQKAFRTSHGPRAVEALNSAWHQLVAQASESFHAGRKEPELTEMLCFYLEQTRADHRLPGQWMNETPQGQIVMGNAQAKVKDRKRTDIRYFTERDVPTTNLVFEFKKLSHQKPQRDKYIGTEGMLRFITGEYSKGDPVALMVGILTTHDDDSVPPLLKRLEDAAVRAQLFMGKQPICKPSGLFGCARFDTEHVRPKDKAPSHGTIVISHLFLGFPDLPRAKVPRARRAELQSALEA